MKQTIEKLTEEEKQKLARVLRMRLDADALEREVKKAHGERFHGNQCSEKTVEFFGDYALVTLSEFNPTCLDSAA